MNLKLNADRFTGQQYIDTYDKYRPSPPKEIIQQALNYLNKTKADIVLDLGCGTGISTEVWKNFANKTIGVEPSKEMIAIAKQKLTTENNIEYLVGYSNNILLPSDSIDIICCSQSFHWMEPASTLTEVNRLLKENGVLLIYDVIWPPSTNFVFEKAYNKLFEQVDRLTKKLPQQIAHSWNKKNHLTNIQKTKQFKFAKETYFHKTERLTKDQFIGIALSQGGLEALLKRGFSNEAIGSMQLAVNSMQSSVGSLQLAVCSWQLAVGSFLVGSMQLAVGSWQLAVF